MAKYGDKYRFNFQELKAGRDLEEVRFWPAWTGLVPSYPGPRIVSYADPYPSTSLPLYLSLPLATSLSLHIYPSTSLPLYLAPSLPSTTVSLTTMKVLFRPALRWLNTARLVFTFRHPSLFTTLPLTRTRTLYPLPSTCCQPFHLSASPPLHLSTSLPLHLSTSPPLHLSTSLPLHLSTSLPLHLSTSPPLTRTLTHAKVRREVEEARTKDIDFNATFVHEPPDFSRIPAKVNCPSPLIYAYPLAHPSFISPPRCLSILPNTHGS